MNIRRALPTESEELSELAIAAKSLWGYSAAQIAEWADELRITPESILDEPTFIAEEEEAIVGVVQLCTKKHPWVIDSLWIHPSAMRRGVGSLLVRHALGSAKSQGQDEMAIDADPNAEEFYLRIGARRVGEVVAPIEGQPGRVRPQLMISTQDSV